MGHVLISCILRFPVFILSMGDVLIEEAMLLTFGPGTGEALPLLKPNHADGIDDTWVLLTLKLTVQLE